MPVRSPGTLHLYRGAAARLNQGYISTLHVPTSSYRKEEFVEENFIALL